MQTKTDLYWQQYDTETARTVAAAAAAGAAAAPAERGMSPNKAPTAAERAHRQEAWRLAQEGYAATLPAGTTQAETRQAWTDLEWQDKALRYWTAYEDPTSRRAVTAAAATAGATAVAAEAGELSRERVIQLNEQAADYFSAQAGQGSKGRPYLEGRLGAGAVEHSPFRVGYAPAGWTNLTDHLRRGGATPDEILGAGLGRMSSRGNVVDAFRDRATVAIRDEAGATIGFVGRDLSGAATAPKYVNTGGTPAYTKGDHLLGLHEASEGARLVRVEGPFDAMAVTAAGEGRYAGVAPLGTTLTAAQADTLAARSGGRVWEALDGDVPGSRATEEDFWLLRERGVDARLIPLPKGTDPAQLWRENPDQLRTLLDVADAAPTAGLAVVDNTVRDLRSALRNGEVGAFDELAMVQDKIAHGLPNHQDRAQVDAYTTATVEQLRDQADQARDGANRLDVIDGRAAAAAAVSDPGRAERLEATAERAHEGSDRFASRASDSDAAAGQAAGATYDRSAVTSPATPPVSGATPETVPVVKDGEASEARRASAPGFSRPTRDMLVDAVNRPGTQARPATQPATNLGRGRTQRR